MIKMIHRETLTVRYKESGLVFSGLIFLIFLFLFSLFELN